MAMPTPHLRPDVITRTNLFFSHASKSWPLDQTLRLLPLLPTRDTVTWNVAISAAVRHRCPAAALRLFRQMLLSSSSLPDAITIRTVLRAIGQSNGRDLLPQLHAHILKLLPRFASIEQTILITCFLNLCFEFEFPSLARQLFDRIPHRDAVAFTSMLSGFGDSGKHETALSIFVEMIKECDHDEMNEHAYSCALRSCAGVPCLDAGMQIHARVIGSMMGSNVFVGTALVDMYVKCGEVEHARRAFSEIDEPNVVSWNAMMGGCVDADEAVRVFGRMRLSGVAPDHVTFANVLRACKDDGDVGLYGVRQLHCLVVKVFEHGLDVFVGGALLEMYLDRGCFDESRMIFGDLREKDSVAFNLAIQGYVRNGHGEEAVGLLLEALKMGKELSEVTMSSLLTWVGGGLAEGKQLHALLTKFRVCDPSIAGSLVRMYSEHRCYNDAIRLFERIRHPDLVSWTSLISGFARSGESRAALTLYSRMITEGMVEPPNHFTFSTLLSSCANLIAVEEGKQIHSQIVKSKHEINCDPFVVTGLFYMYSKFGYMKEAIRLFDEMPERDLASWNAMIASLSQHGYAEKAIETFQQLLKQTDLEPNHISYVGVLSACSRGGMVEEGIRYFKSIGEPTADHYSCLVDLFARTGQFKEALDVVERMPFEANELIWSSLLGASSSHGNVELGEYAAKQLLLLDPRDPGTYLALSNLYAAAERWENVRQIRKLMRSQTDRRYLGISWLMLNGEKCVFSANGRRNFVSE